MARKPDGKLYFQWDAGSHGKKKWRYYSQEVLPSQGLAPCPRGMAYAYLYDASDAHAAVDAAMHRTRLRLPGLLGASVRCLKRPLEGTPCQNTFLQVGDPTHLQANSLLVNSYLAYQSSAGWVWVARG